MSRHFASKAITRSLACSIRSVVNQIVSFCRNRDVNVQTTHFCYSHVSTVETEFWNFGQPLSEESVLLIWLSRRGSLRRTLTSKSALWHDSSHKGSSSLSFLWQPDLKLGGCFTLLKTNYESEIRSLSSYFCIQYRDSWIHCCLQRIV